MSGREVVGYVYESPSVREFTFVISRDAGDVGVGDYVVVREPGSGGRELLGRVEDVARDVHEGIKGEIARASMVSGRPVPNLDWMVVARVEVVGALEDGRLRDPRMPARPTDPVYKLPEPELEDLFSSGELYVGRLKDSRARIFLRLNELLTLHCAVLGMTGSGKSYTVGVLIEEVVERGVPVVVIDPHGEYTSLREPSPDRERLERWGLEPKGLDDVVVFAPEGSDGVRDYSITIDTTKLGQEDFEVLAPELAKRRAAPNVLGQVLKELRRRRNEEGKKYSLEDVVELLERHAERARAAGDMAEYQAARAAIRDLKPLLRYGIFKTQESPDLKRHVRPERVLVLNLRGVPDRAQQIVVTHFLRRLFDLRSKDRIPPVFVVLEEAHNFAPAGEERTTSKTSLSVIRDFAREGRKFMAGLCVVSQRPGRVDTTVLSQCNTMIILRTANPDDLENIRKSGEGITKEALERIKGLPTGTAFITGSAINIPAFVDIRPRRTKHGGETPDVLEELKRWREEHAQEDPTLGL
ncbi:ATP-binding protein [Methanopyrus sp.]